MNELKPEYCGICDLVQIWTRDPKTKKVDITPDYYEISLALSDNTIAQHAICRYCASSLTEKDISKLFGRIQETWFGEMVGWASDKQFDKMRSLKVVAYDSNGDNAKVKNDLREWREKGHKDKLAKAQKERVKIK